MSGKVGGLRQCECPTCGQKHIMKGGASLETRRFEERKADEKKASVSEKEGGEVPVWVR